MFRVGKTMAEQSEVNFFISQTTLPKKPILWGLASELFSTRHASETP